MARLPLDLVYWNLFYAGWDICELNHIGLGGFGCFAVYFNPLRVYQAEDFEFAHSIRALALAPVGYFGHIALELGREDVCVGAGEFQRGRRLAEVAG